VEEAQKVDPFCGPLIRLCKLAADELTLQESSKIRQFSVFDDLLFYTPERGEASVARLCVPASYNNAIRLTVFFEAHEAYLHQGAEKTYQRMYAGYYWPTMISDIKRYVNSCQSCRRMKSRNHAETGALEGHSIPKERWDTLHLDFITDLQPTKEGFDTILVLSVCRSVVQVHVFDTGKESRHFPYHGAAVISDGVFGTWSSYPTHY